MTASERESAGRALERSSLRDKRALVTGGTDGIGREIAVGLGRQGLQLLIVGRDPHKGAQVEQDLRVLTGNPHIDFLQADLSLMREVRRLGSTVRARWRSLHYLVHSAGVVLGCRESTAERLESSFAINYLSRFELTRELLPLLAVAGQADTAARILLVSGAARGRIQFDDVNLARFTTLRAVRQSCRANDVFALELARRLALATPVAPVTVTCLKLGPVVKTNIRRRFPGWMKLLVPLLVDPLLGQTPQAAAEAALRLLLADDFEGVTGALFLKFGRLKSVAPSGAAEDSDDGERLWHLSEQLLTEARSLAAGSAADAAARQGRNSQRHAVHRA